MPFPTLLHLISQEGPGPGTSFADWCPRRPDPKQPPPPALTHPGRYLVGKETLSGNNVHAGEVGQVLKVKALARISARQPDAERASGGVTASRNLLRLASS